MVSLRKLKLSDAERFATLANTKNIWQFMRDSFPYPYSKNEAIQFIDYCNEHTENHIFGIMYKNELVGATGLHAQDDINRYSMELGYWLGEAYWNKGIATQTVALILQYGFDNLDINRIFAGTLQSNLASAKVLEKNNFKLEGITKQSAYKNSQFQDEYHFAILKEYYAKNH